MGLDRRDALATILVAAIVVPYVWYTVAGRAPFIQDPRGMAATALVLGGIAAVTLGRRAFRGDLGRIAASVAVLSGAIGVIALVWAEEADIGDVLLGVFIVSIVVAWVLAELGRSDRSRSGERSTRG